MEFKLKRIVGLDDALVSLTMSKRTYTPELAEQIRQLVDDNTTKRGYVIENPTPEFMEKLDKLVKYGIEYNHATLLRYIDFSIEVVGLHRGAQDDLDSHAARMNNRIVRSSTRLAKFKTGEKSDYYKDKILYTDEVVDCPSEIEKDGVKYVKTPFGYTREDLKDNNDALRGNYSLAIPNDNIFKINLVDLRHVYLMRNEQGHANPELKQGVEMVADQIDAAIPSLGKFIRHDLALTKNGLQPVHCMDIAQVDINYLRELENLLKKTLENSKKDKYEKGV